MVFGRLTYDRETGLRLKDKSRLTFRVHTTIRANLACPADRLIAYSRRDALTVQDSMSTGRKA